MAKATVALRGRQIPIGGNLASFLLSRMITIQRGKYRGGKRLAVIEPRPNGRWGKVFVLKGIRP